MKWRDAFERDGFSSRVVCVKVVSLYPKSIMDRSFFALFLILGHHRARARTWGHDKKNCDRPRGPCNGLDLFISLIGILLIILASV